MKRGERRIQKAVIPAAGLGSRMLPITRGVPKEMLPVGRKPMVQHVVEEAAASGLKQICIVIREGKEVIREYFNLKTSTGKSHEAVAELEALVAACELTFVFQKHQLGVGDALLQARDFVGTESFVMMIPDQLMFGPTPAASQLLSHWRPGAAIWSSLMRLPKEERSYFAGARGVEYEEINKGEVVINRLRTEDETLDVHKTLEYEVRGFGRTIFPPEIFEYLGPMFADSRSGEVDLLKTFETCTKQLKVFGIWLKGDPIDLGTFRSYYHFLPRLWANER